MRFSGLGRSPTTSRWTSACVLLRKLCAIPGRPRGAVPRRRLLLRRRGGAAWGDRPLALARNILISVSKANNITAEMAESGYFRGRMLRWRRDLLETPGRPAG